MGAVFAGAARAPITAVVILFELTGEYTIILPLMLAIVLATGISHLVSHDTVYTRKLLRRGIDIDEPADATLRRRPVSDVMTTPPAPVEAEASLRSVAARFATAGGGSLPVTDSAGHYLGTLAAHDLMDALASGEDTTVQALTVSTTPLGTTSLDRRCAEATRHRRRRGPHPGRRRRHRRLGPTPGHAHRPDRHPVSRCPRVTLW